MSQRPNVLLLCADMIGPRAFGCYGAPESVTPNLDRLAAGGIRFDNAYCACPPCIPARVSMMSGQYARTHGKLAHVRMELQPRPPLIPDLLARHGYQTGLVGKTHWWPPNDTLGCDHAYVTIDNGLVPELGNDDAYIRFLRERGLFDYDPPGDWESREVIMRLRPDRLPPECLRVNWTGDTACRLMDRFAAEEAPFFLFCSFVEPHTHNSVQSDRKEAFRDLAVPPLIVDDLHDKPALQRAYAKEVSDKGSKTIRDPLAYRRGVLASLSLVDENIGRILDRLETLGIADNTLVLFTSDHGDLMGDHGLIEKTFLYDTAIKVPMLLRPPRPAASAGAGCGQATAMPSVRAHLVSHVDLLPTVLDGCGIDDWKALPIEGRSMMPLVRDPAAEWRDTLYCEVAQTHCRVYGSSMLKMVRRDNWKYVYTLVDGHEVSEELYDLARDPDELTNLAEVESATTRALRDTLLRWMVATEANRIRPLPENEKWNTVPYPVPRINRRWF